ncbi:MAG: hypothetical protein J7J93_02720 [Candidatus Aenigmarchaeota archaeon]|nr:hypothetical protein [Candidatus Aenigmarchaeota archaeon]
MECQRCHSHRLIRFIDGFGNRRIFCRDCYASILESNILQGFQTKLPEFGQSSPKISPIPSGLSFS